MEAKGLKAKSVGTSMRGDTPPLEGDFIFDSLPSISQDFSSDRLERTVAFSQPTRCGSLGSGMK